MLCTVAGLCPIVFPTPRRHGALWLRDAAFPPNECRDGRCSTPPNSHLSRRRLRFGRVRHRMVSWAAHEVPISRSPRSPACVEILNPRRSERWKERPPRLREIVSLLKPLAYGSRASVVEMRLDPLTTAVLPARLPQGKYGIDACSRVPSSGTLLSATVIELR